MFLFAFHHHFTTLINQLPRNRLMNTVVVIPAYNEERYIAEVINGVKLHVPDIIVVDDGSSDRTSAIAKGMGAVVLRNIINMGKGFTLRQGCDYAIKHGADKIVVLDADNQHSVEKLPEFIAALDDYEMVFGYRELSSNMPAILRFGNRVINRVTQALYNINLNDTQCGYRAFRGETYAKIRWSSADYSMESEMIAHAGKNHIKYTQIPIETRYLDKYKGTTIIDGVGIVINLFKWRM